MADYYMTIHEAAFLMGMSEETVRKMIESGQLLYRKNVSGIDGSELIMIHESEMSRFQHPWQQISRLEQRVNAQQELVETLKKKIVGSDEMFSYRRSEGARLEDIAYEHQEMIDRIKAIEEELGLAKKAVVEIRENQQGVAHKLDKEIIHNEDRISDVRSLIHNLTEMLTFKRKKPSQQGKGKKCSGKSSD